MAAAAWPLAGVDLLMDGNSVGFGEGALVTGTPDVGPPIIRQRASAIGDPISGSIFVTSAQLATFKTFYKTTLGRGSLPFTWVNPDDGSAILCCFNPYANPPSWVNLSGNKYRIQIDILVLP